MAALLLDRFGSLGTVLASDQPTIHHLLPGYPQVVFHLGACRAAMLHTLRRRLSDRPILGSSNDLDTYLIAKLAHQPTEQFYVLFLDGGNRLIRDEAIGSGTVSEAVIYPREIMRRALELRATGIILVHNHPSGNPAPSDADRTATGAVCDAAQALGIRVHDHVIVSREGAVSFRRMGLL